MKCEGCGEEYIKTHLINGKCLCFSCRNNRIKCDRCHQYFGKNVEDGCYSTKTNRTNWFCWDCLLGKKNTANDEEEYLWLCATIKDKTCKDFAAELTTKWQTCTVTLEEIAEGDEDDVGFCA